MCPTGEDLGDRRRRSIQDGDGDVDGDRSRHQRQCAALPQGLPPGASRTRAAAQGRFALILALTIVLSLRIEKNSLS